MRRLTWPLAAAALLLWAPTAQAWLGRGHDLAARAAVEASADRMPAFLAAGVGQIAHDSLDPDTWTRPLAPPALHAAESSEHYFDQELLAGLTPPPRRDKYLRLCAAKGIDPTRVGFLPYTITEWTGRLTVALAEHRRWPDNPYIRADVLMCAGVLSHYAADLHQPLHVSVDYDGRAGPDGKSPRSGIHLKVDALAAKLTVGPRELAAGLEVQPVEDVFSAVMQRVAAVHGWVGRVYELEPQLPAKDEPLAPGSPVEPFAREQMRAAAAFTASLYLTAWRDSEKVAQDLPDWHVSERSDLDGRSIRQQPASCPR